MKKTKIIIICVLAIAVTLIVGRRLLFYGDNNVQLSRSERQVTLSDGVLDPEMAEMQFTIDEDAEYELGIKWELSEPGILNGIRIVNQQNETLFACTGDWADIESLPLYLETGDYIMETHYLTSEEALIEFCELAELQLESGEQYDYAKEGQWNIKYEFTMQKTDNSFLAIAVAIGLVVGLLVAVIIIAISKKTDTVKADYDERQELVRGKGFKYGFFTMLLSDVLLCLLYSFELTWFAQLEVALILSAIAGVIVYACYCVLNDGYFALNENRKMLLIFFALAGAINLVLGIINICNGYGFADGRFTMASTNLFCGIMVMILFATILYKQIKESREE